MGTVVATWGLTLLAVIVGALASTGTQVYLDRKREHREADRAKQLVAGELLHAQAILRSVPMTGDWPPFEDADVYFPTSAWKEHRSRLAGELDEDLWNQLVLAYMSLEIERARFVDRARFHNTGQLPIKPLTAEEADSLKKTAIRLGKLRRQLYGAAGWEEEILGGQQ